MCGFCAKKIAALNFLHDCSKDLDLQMLHNFSSLLRVGGFYSVAREEC